MTFALPCPRAARRVLGTFSLLWATAVAAAGPSTQFTITGGVQHPATVTVPDLQAEPAITQTVTFAAGSSSQTHTYVGASLWGALDSAGLVVDPAVKNDVLDQFVVATGSDGYRVVLSLGELNPNFGARPDLIAYAERVGATVVPLGTDGFARTTAPDDAKGGRYLSNLVNLDVRSAKPSQGSIGGGPSRSFSVTGNVTADHTFDVAALQALAPVTRTVAGVTYTGVSLWDLLTTSVGIPSNAAVKNDLLGKYVVATGSDGYSVVFSLGELDPSFGGQPDFIAYLANGVSLGVNGFARIVVPNDVRMGRWVSDLISLQVFSVPEPATASIVPIGLLMIAGLARRRRTAA